MKTYYIYIVSLLLLGTSCQDWFDGALPKDQNLEKQQFSTELGISSMLTGLYTSMEEAELYGSTLSFKELEMMAHYYYYTSGASGSNPYEYTAAVSTYDYNHASVKATFSRVWEKMYNTIFQVNLFIKNVEDSPVLPVNRWKLYVGEAYALRAYLHFDIFRLFGNKDNTQLVPYNTSDEVVPQQGITANEFFQKIKEDLEKAKALLANDPIKSQEKILEIIGNDEAASADPSLRMYEYARNYRMNAYAVDALEARILLYFGQTDDAANIAKRVLTEAFGTDKPFRPVDPLNLGTEYLFYKEVLFGLYSMDIYSRWEREIQSNLAGQVLDVSDASLRNNIYRNDRITADISLWEDIRSRQWKTSRMPTRSYISERFSRFAVPTQEGTYTNDHSMIPLLRVGEMELIVIESMIESKRYTEAMEALNNFRFRRGTQFGALPDPATATTEKVNDILETEYYKEFYGEGQSFYFLKRKNKDKIINVQAAGTLPMDTLKYTVPLPADEINN